MVSAEHARGRFQRFSSVQSECPLCGSTDVAYDFVLRHVAFSQCTACQLLYGNRSVSPDPAAGSLRDAPVAEILALVTGYSGEAPQSVVAIGLGGEERIGNVPVRDPESLASDERFDAIVVVGGICADDPLLFVESLERHLTQRGTMLFMLPSTASRSAKRDRSAWKPLLSASRYFFCPDTLQLLATRAGLGDFISFVDARDVAKKPSGKLAAWFHSNFVLMARAARSSEPRTLSVIFPVFNEESTVEESLGRVLGKQIPGVDIEVVIVESNSTDGSRALVEKYRDHPKVRLVLEDRPRGKGYAVRTGLTHARGEVVLFQDADLEYDVEDYDALVAPLFELRRNFVLGSRHNPKRASWKIRQFADQPLVATVANLAHVALLGMFNTIYKQRLRDPFTMYKVFRRDCLYGLTFECNRFDFDFEINIKLLRKGYQPIELPVNYLSRSFKEGKKVSFFGDPPTWVRAMLRLRRIDLYSFGRLP